MSIWLTRASIRSTRASIWSTQKCLYDPHERLYDQHKCPNDPHERLYDQHERNTSVWMIKTVQMINTSVYMINTSVKIINMSLQMCRETHILPDRHGIFRYFMYTVDFYVCANICASVCRCAYKQFFTQLANLKLYTCSQDCRYVIIFIPSLLDKTSFIRPHI